MAGLKLAVGVNTGTNDPQLTGSKKGSSKKIMQETEKNSRNIHLSYFLPVIG